MQKHFPGEVTLHMCQWLGTNDLLSLSCTEKYLYDLLESKQLWLQHAKKYGLYQPEFNKLECTEIKARITALMKAIYREIRTICHKKNYAKQLTYLLMEDDAEQLELQVLKTATRSAKALMPIAMQFGRIRIIDSLFTHFNVPGSYHWLLWAIHYEHYAAVKYMVEIKRIPLITDKASALLPSINSRWDNRYQTNNSPGRFHPTTFLHYNQVLLHEIIRCRHPKIVQYLKNKFHELLDQDGTDHPERYLFARMKRHSVENLSTANYCDSPDLSNLRKAITSI
jgi:hypothetical protein